MSRSQVDNIKKNQQMLISKSSNASYGVIYGAGTKIKYDACFARVAVRINEIRGNKGSMQYIFRIERGWGVFNYDKLFKELNTIFSAYFKIVRCKSGTRNVRILDIQEVKEFENPRIRVCAWNVLLVILRSMEAEYLVTRWYPLVRDSPKIFPVDNLRDVIRYYYKLFQTGGHGINDDLYELSKSKTRGGKKLYNLAVDNYITVIEKAFGGKGFNFNKRGVKSRVNKVETRYNYGGKNPNPWYIAQTSSFQLIERIVKEVK